MIKKGDFGIYKGKEYRITEDMDGNLLIMTKDPNKITNEFKDKYNSGVYTKKIDRDDLSEYYFIKPIAKYKGEKFNLSIQENENYVLLGTDDATLARKFGFDRTDKYYYEKWVPLDEVRITEEKEEL